jgi:protein-L-isoaspartate(D-aspartate) O-methyltransferase
MLHAFTDGQSDSFAEQRSRMIESQLWSRGIRDERVLDAMARVPRHEFVSPEYRSQAYDDHPLPIAGGQTISQPFIVALMLEHLRLAPSETVLEIGTGSGYQTALLAELVARVYSMERHAALAAGAVATLRKLGYSNVTIVTGDGSLGLPEQAPFDAIIVSAAASSVPPALFEQLREGGRMIIPVGAEDAQELQLVRKLDGRPQTTRLEGCRFVPLIGGSKAGDF